MPLSTIRLAVLRTRRASDDKLIGGKYQPGKDWISLWQGIFGLISRRQELLDALLVARPGLLHGHFMLRATKLSRQLRFRAEDNRHTLPWHHLQAKCAGLIHILTVGQAALCVTPVLHTPEPVPCGGIMNRRSQDKDAGWGPVIRTYAAAIPVILSQKMPVGISTCRAMVIAVETERSERERQRRVTLSFTRRGRERILHICCVLSVFHPDALLQREVFVQSIAKTGDIGL